MKQSSLFELFGFVCAVAILGYWIHTSNLAKREEERKLREAEAASLAAERAAELAFVDRIKANDTEFLSSMIYRCASIAQDASTYNVTVDHRDSDQVRRLLENLHPYDHDSKIEYVGLRELGQTELSRLVGKTALEDFKLSGRMELTFAVTYTQDSFAGLKSAWAILSCPIISVNPRHLT